MDRSRDPRRKFALQENCPVLFCMALAGESCIDHRGWPVSPHWRRIERVQLPGYGDRLHSSD